jgi:hypothetical protein
METQWVFQELLWHTLYNQPSENSPVIRLKEDWVLIIILTVIKQTNKQKPKQAS